LSQEKLALPDMFTEKKKLEKRIAELEEEKHLKLVSEIVDLTIALGSIEPEDSQKEFERLRKFDNHNLILIKQELERFIERIVKKQGGWKLDRHMRLVI